jgi:hypothetical protein
MFGRLVMERMTCVTTSKVNRRRKVNELRKAVLAFGGEDDEVGCDRLDDCHGNLGSGVSPERRCVVCPESLLRSTAVGNSVDSSGPNTQLGRQQVEEDPLRKQIDLSANSGVKFV